MVGKIKYTAKADPGKFNLNFGGFGMKMNGQNILFDLDDYSANRDNNDQSILIFEAKRLDKDVTRYVNECDGNEKLQNEMENWKEIDVAEIFEFSANLDANDEKFNDEIPETVEILELLIGNDYCEEKVRADVIKAAKI